MNEVDSSMEETGVWQVATSKNTNSSTADDSNIVIDDDVGVLIMGRIKPGEEKSVREKMEAVFNKKIDGYMALHLAPIGPNTLVRTSLENDTNIEKAQRQLRRAVRSMGINPIDPTK